MDRLLVELEIDSEGMKVEDIISRVTEFLSKYAEGAVDITIEVLKYL